MTGPLPQEVAATLGAKKDGGWRGDLDNETYVPERQAFGGNNTSGPINVAPALLAHPGSGWKGDFDSETFIAETPCVTGDVTHTLTTRCGGRNASEDGTGRGTPIIPVAYDIHGVPASAGATPTDLHSALRARAPGASEASTTTVVVQQEPIAFHGAQDPDVSGDVTHPLGRNQGQEVCIAFAGRGSNLSIRDGLSATMTSNADRASGGAQCISQGWQVRRLTPMECERLQGFPDGFTDVEFRGKPAADGPRYKALGNSMAVPVLRWLLTRLEAATRAARKP